jgi:hypothetical protein
MARRGKWVLSGAAALAAALLAWWWLPGTVAAPAAASASVDTSPNNAAPQALTATLPSSAAARPPPPGPPLSPLGEAQRREQLALWQGRLERARNTLDAYRIAAQYPHESRPIEEHPDQVRPFEPIAEERALRMPGGGATQGVRLKTTQERVFASGTESSRVTVQLTNEQGQVLPLRVARAVMREVTPPGRTQSTVDFPMPVNDAGPAGNSGDTTAGDGTFTATMQPGAQGFRSFAGTVRLELNLEYAGQPGFIYFDLTYSPQLAATWLPGVREVQTAASLDFMLKAQVLIAGRYVVSARVDDASGQPISLALFNAEVPAGTAEFRLPVFGKLLRDKGAKFPLTLRDIEAFLLVPDTFPDRTMLPRLAGAVHTSKSYMLASFSSGEWQSEERERYLTELGKDVAQAEQKVKALGP